MTTDPATLATRRLLGFAGTVMKKNGVMSLKLNCEQFLFFLRDSQVDRTTNASELSASPSRKEGVLVS